MNIGIRVDASVVIGSGHVMRCLTLANALRRAGHEVLFVCRDYPGNMTPYIATEKFNVCLLPFFEKERYAAQVLSDRYSNWLWVSETQDADEVSNRIKIYLDWMIVDHYALGGDWELSLRRNSKHLMVIDDLANRKHVCDILLDQNYYLNAKIRYQSFASTRCKQLLGPVYALIRPEILALHERRVQLRKKTTPLSNITILMGGADSKNMTLQVLQQLEKSKLILNYNLDVILGPANVHGDDVKDFCKTYSNIAVHFTPLYFTDLLMKSDLVIGSGGSGVYERCFAGIPSIVFSLAENQYQICSDVAAAGAHIFIEHVSALSSKLRSLTFEKRDRMLSAGFRLFLNYQGAEGVVDAIQSY
ncbi:MAG: Pseudaminic acid biosynthesis-associated protein PseG [uncultured bacterium]|nr:MAG: Pseudaminic acid biosynthesis-associated protein PseG [uncultured bacterium]OGT25462.1 MAG: UDP-2,4-diacetamido-2,4,6-trideoxy-beta-L-altropyranose hydrolase [Gammaproteobacteria bacterium RIFCSPHIGHO2_02_FULL_42_43]OGT27529.1 MAG: UDP-2,4-diacetamido-2,4,6-trideoxy-beta-L-altropyranose hydrolase [Gammaproteobacteria bacterium RIFCSPHIGHO2_01_FULL_42_8]OGT51413.1 MAG: UDP-2,4-diacetamido-2,4,6-trideoxy-beta-L-altropyranose hydrolase [Gammaproteobacteria bacterium RIFCSPHIGHO2_12_FULL_41_